MNIKLPQIPQQDNIAKFFSVLQFLCFLVLFIGFYLLLRRLVHAFLLRVLILILDYIVVSFVSYLVLRLLFARAEKAMREKQK